MPGEVWLIVWAASVIAAAFAGAGGAWAVGFWRGVQWARDHPKPPPPATAGPGHPPSLRSP